MLTKQNNSFKKKPGPSPTLKKPTLRPMPCSPHEHQTCQTNPSAQVDGTTGSQRLEVQVDGQRRGPQQPRLQGVAEEKAALGIAAKEILRFLRKKQTLLQTEVYSGVFLCRFSTAKNQGICKAKVLRHRSPARDAMGLWLRAMELLRHISHIICSNPQLQRTLHASKAFNWGLSQTLLGKMKLKPPPSTPCLSSDFFAGEPSLKVSSAATLAEMQANGR